MSRLANDYCVFKNANATLFIIVYVDDLAILSDSTSAAEELLTYLESKVELKRLGDLSSFIGLQIDYSRTNRTLHLHQSRYAVDVLKRFHMQESRSVVTPMERKAEDQAGSPETDVKHYQAAIGSLMYLTDTCQAR